MPKQKKDDKPVSSPARIAASIKYNADHVVQVKFNFNKETDADIIAHLKSLKNKQGYVKSLIRKDMQNNGG
jgi:hypothetical protein